MAVSISKNAAIKIDGNLIGQLLSWDYSETDSQVDISNFDSSRREFAPLTLVDGDANFEAHFDLADAGQDSLRAALGAAATAIIIYPAGTGTGAPTLTGTIIVAAHTVTGGGLEDAITVSFSGKLSALAEDTVPA